MFEGEYYNGYRWNGKIYDNINNNIIYELKNGKGYIKEYNLYNDLIFEGEYLNGKRNGKGKEFDLDWNLIYEGEFFYGKKLQTRKDDILNTPKKELEYDINGNIIEKGYDEYGSFVFKEFF